MKPIDKELQMAVACGTPTYLTDALESMAAADGELKGHCEPAQLKRAAREMSSAIHSLIAHARCTDERIDEQEQSSHAAKGEREVCPSCGWVLKAPGFVGSCAPGCPKAEQHGGDLRCDYHSPEPFPPDRCLRERGHGGGHYTHSEDRVNEQHGGGRAGRFSLPATTDPPHDWRPYGDREWMCARCGLIHGATNAIGMPCRTVEP